jgi:membrane-associated phospholipid phosphatase
LKTIREYPFYLSDPCSVFLAKVFSILFILSIGTTATAADSTQTIFQTIGSDIALGWSDLGPYFTKPLHFDGTDWRNASLIIGGTAIAASLDRAGRNFALKSPHDQSFDNVMTAFQHYGETYTIGFAGAGYIVGLASGSSAIRTTSREIIETLLLSGITTTAIKFIVGRSRPYLGAGPYDFHPFTTNDDRNSLPSGHTTVAFAISSVLAARIDHPLASILLYGAATCTAFARMYHDRHWFSDTFLGAAIATSTGLWVVKRDEDRSAGSLHSENKLIITPNIGGVSLTYNF